jgi:DNA (cytosine-5)-methyltransferase 1
MRNIKFFDYCAGLGAFRAGFAQAGGFDCVGWCEIDKTAQTAYRALYDTEKEFFHDDATTLDGRNIPDFDMLAGGIPCQAWSSAGKKRGFDDPRGQLFFDFARILAERHPPLFCIENVPALLRADGGRAFETMLCRISELGYHVQWQCIDGSAYLPQRRIRLFLIGSFDFRLLGKIFPVGLGGEAFPEKLIETPPVAQIQDLLRVPGNLAASRNDCEQWNRVCGSGDAACTQMAGGGSGSGNTGMYFIDMNADPKITDESRCITARYDGGIGRFKGEKSGVLIEESGTYPCINPTKERVRQSKRIRADGSPAYVITAQDRHGVIHEGRIRRLCPQEVFRLMGFSDEQFFKVQAVISSDTKLYKLGGNSIMVPILAELGAKLRAACEEINLFESEA